MRRARAWVLLWLLLWNVLSSSLLFEEWLDPQLMVGVAPFHIERGNPLFYRDFSPSFEQLLQLVSSKGGAHTIDIRYSTEKKARPAPSFEESLIALQQGFSFVIHLIDFIEHTSLFKLLIDLEEYFRMPVTMNYYVGGPDSEALPPHSDRYDIFILQLEGTKDWTFCIPDLSDIPETSSFNDAEVCEYFSILTTSDRGDQCGFFTQKELDRMGCKEITLEQGDLLYLPKSTPHVAVAGTGGSAHVAIGIRRDGGGRGNGAFTWRAFMESAISRHFSAAEQRGGGAAAAAARDAVRAALRRGPAAAAGGRPRGGGGGEPAALLAWGAPFPAAAAFRCPAATAAPARDPSPPGGGGGGLRGGEGGGGGGGGGGEERAGAGGGGGGGGWCAPSAGVAAGLRATYAGLLRDLESSLHKQFLEENIATEEVSNVKYAYITKTELIDEVGRILQGELLTDLSFFKEQLFFFREQLESAMKWKEGFDQMQASVTRWTWTPHQSRNLAATNYTSDFSSTFENDAGLTCSAITCECSSGCSTCTTGCDSGCSSSCDLSCDAGCDSSCNIFGNNCDDSCDSDCDSDCDDGCTTACDDTCSDCSSDCQVVLGQMPAAIDESAACAAVIDGTYASLCNATETNAPTLAPTVAPTLMPTLSPTAAPTLPPTEAPTLAPTEAPTLMPTLSPTAAPTMPCGYSYGPYCYLWSGSDGAADYSTAAATCKGYNATLVSISSELENYYIYEYIVSANGETSSPIWIGYSDSEVEGTYVWEDGSSSTYTNWNTGEPNDAGSIEDCVAMYTEDSGSGGYWNDEYCSSSYNFVCKWTPSCPTDVWESAVKELSPTLFWRLDANTSFANDSSTGGNDGVLIQEKGANVVNSESPYSSLDGSITIAPDPSGTNASYYISNKGAWLSGATSHSLAIWAKTSNFSGCNEITQRSPISFQNSTQSSITGVTWSCNDANLWQLSIGVNNEYSTETISTSVSCSSASNQWAFLTSTYDSSTNTMTAYVDGEEQGSLTPSSYSNGEGPLQVGNSEDGLFCGSVDEAIFWSYCLTELEVSDLYLSAPLVLCTDAPTNAPTAAPTVEPTAAPTKEPTLAPTQAPSFSPTASPTLTPSLKPTVSPTLTPSLKPTVSPTLTPSLKPTVSPTRDAGQYAAAFSIQLIGVNGSSITESVLESLETSFQSLLSVPSSSQISISVSFRRRSILLARHLSDLSATLAVEVTGLTTAEYNEVADAVDTASENGSFLSALVDAGVAVESTDVSVTSVEKISLNTESSLVAYMNITNAYETWVEFSCHVDAENVTLYYYVKSDGTTASSANTVFSFGESFELHAAGSYTFTVKDLESDTQYGLTVYATQNGIGMADTLFRLFSTAPSPPALMSAVFSSSGGYITIKFDSETDKGDTSGISTTFDCSSLFLYTGVSSYCQWLSSSHVKMVLKSSSLIVPGDELVQRADLLKAKCTWSDCTGWSLAGNSTVSVAGPATLVPPTVVLSYPQTIGECDELELDATGTYGSAGRSLTYNWSTNSTGALNTLMATASASGAALVILPASTLLSQYRYAFALNVTNFLGASASAVAHVKVKAGDVPLVKITGADELTMYSSDELYLKASASISTCNSSSSRTLSYSWAVNGVETTSSSVDPRIFKMQKYSLASENDYTVTVHVTSSSGSNSSASISVHVLQAPLHAVISGGDFRTLSLSKATLVMDASQSYDEDDGSILSPQAFTWLCESAGPPCIVDDLLLANVSVLNLTLPSLNFTAGISYHFTVVVVDGPRSDNASVEIMFTEASIPGSEIEPTSTTYEDLDNVNAEETFILTGRLSRSGSASLRKRMLTSSTSAISSTWYMDEDASSPFQTVNSLEEAATSSVSSTYSSSVTSALHYLVINEDEMVSGGSYVFYFSCAYEGEEDAAISSVTVVMNEPPTSGTLTISPEAGTSLADTFDFLTMSWVDDAEDYPFTYKFLYYYAASSADAVLLRGHDYSNRHDGAYLPQGSASDNYTLTAGVEVMDAPGGTATATAGLRVEPYEGGLAEAAALADTVLQALLEELDLDGLHGAVAAFASYLAQPNCTVAPASTCSSLGRQSCESGSTDHTCGDCQEDLEGSEVDFSSACITPADSCSNGKWDLANETDIDCGGEFCGPCDEGDACVSDSDCALGLCSGGKCGAALKTCPANCTQRGACVYFGPNGQETEACYSDNDFCSAECVCDQGFFGGSCSLDSISYSTKQDFVASLFGAFSSALEYSDTTVENLNQDSTSANALSNEIALMNATLQLELLNITLNLVNGSVNVGGDYTTSDNNLGVISNILSDTSLSAGTEESNLISVASNNIVKAMLAGVVPGSIVDDVISDEIRSASGVYDFSTEEASFALSSPLTDDEQESGSLMRLPEQASELLDIVLKQESDQIPRHHITPRNSLSAWQAVSAELGQSLDGLSNVEVFLSEFTSSPYTEAYSTNESLVSTMARLGVFELSSLLSQNENFTFTMILQNYEAQNYAPQNRSEVSVICEAGEVQDKEISCGTQNTTVSCTGTFTNTTVSCAEGGTAPRCLLWDGDAWDSSMCEVIHVNETSTECRCTFSSQWNTRRRLKSTKRSKSESETDEAIDVCSDIQSIGSEIAAIASTITTLELSDVQETLVIFVTLVSMLTLIPLLSIGTKIAHKYKGNFKWTCPTLKKNSFLVSSLANSGKMRLSLWKPGERLQQLQKRWVEENDWIQLVLDQDAPQERVVRCTLMMAGILTLMFWDSTLSTALAKSNADDYNVTSSSTSLSECEVLSDKSTCSDNSGCYWYSSECISLSTSYSTMESMLYVSMLSLILTAPCLMVLSCIADRTIAEPWQATNSESSSKEEEVLGVAAAEQEHLVSEQSAVPTDTTPRPEPARLVGGGPKPRSTQPVSIHIIKSGIPPKRQRKTEKPEWKRKIKAPKTSHHHQDRTVENAGLIMSPTQHEDKDTIPTGRQEDRKRGSFGSCTSANVAGDTKISIQPFPAVPADSIASSSEQWRRHLASRTASPEERSTRSPSLAISEFSGHRHSTSELIPDLFAPDNNSKGSIFYRITRSVAIFFSRYLTITDLRSPSHMVELVDDEAAKSRWKADETSVYSRMGELFELDTKKHSESSICGSKVRLEIHKDKLRNLAEQGLLLEAHLEAYLEIDNPEAAELRLLQAAHWDTLSPLERRAVRRLQEKLVEDDLNSDETVCTLLLPPPPSSSFAMVEWAAEKIENGIDKTQRPVLKHVLGWLFMGFYCFACAFYVWLFAVTYGSEYANAWLQSFFIAFTEDVFLFLPIKLVVLYVALPESTTSSTELTRLRQLSPSAPSLQAARKFPYLGVSSLLLEGDVNELSVRMLPPAVLAEFKKESGWSVDNKEGTQGCRRGTWTRGMLLAIFATVLLLPNDLQEVALDTFIAIGGGYVVLYLVKAYIFLGSLYFWGGIFVVIGVCVLISYCLWRRSKQETKKASVTV